MAGKYSSLFCAFLLKFNQINTRKIKHFVAELFDKYSCTNCQEDIPGIRVHCAECTDFDLCLQVGPFFKVFFRELGKVRSRAIRVYFHFK